MVIDMSENTQGAACTDEEYSFARAAGIIVATTKDEQKIHSFAESVRKSCKAPSIQSPAPAIHKIVERFIATVTVDEVEWDCYGNAATILDKPEVIQITLKGSPIDIYDALSKSKISDIRWACELLWLDGAFNSEDFYRGLNKDL